MTGTCIRACLCLYNRRWTRSIQGKRNMSGVDRDEEIAKQVDFYFSPANLAKDRFLKKQISMSSEGGIPIGTLLGFNRIKHLLVGIDSRAEKVRTICRSLRRYSCSAEVSDDREYVKWKGNSQDLEGLESGSKQQPERNTDECTVYVEFGTDLGTDISQDDVRAQFESTVGPVTYVSFPRYSTTGVSKGFAFVEFGEASLVQSALALVKSGSIQWKLLSKSDWTTQKAQYRSHQRCLERKSGRRHFSPGPSGPRASRVPAEPMSAPPCLFVVHLSEDTSSKEAVPLLKKIDGVCYVDTEPRIADVSNEKDQPGSIVVVRLLGENASGASNTDFAAHVDAAFNSRATVTPLEGEGAASYMSHVDAMKQKRKRRRK